LRKFAMLTFNTKIALLGIIALLILVKVGLILLKTKIPFDDLKEMNLRLRTWWIMVVTFSVSIVLGRWGSLAFISLISFFALKEYLTLIPTRPIDRPILYLVYIAIPIQFFWIALNQYQMFIIFIPLFAILVLSVSMVMVGEPHGFLNTIGSVTWGLLITVFSLGHLGFLIVLPISMNPNGGAVGLLMYLIFLTQISDVMQYIVGKSFGRRKVILRVSKGKTWEGLIGGLSTTLILSALLAPWFTPMDHLEGLFAGLLIGITGFFGDVTISALKRDLGVKDAGTLLPGHGGVLDRIDSLILSAPVFFNLVYWLYFYR
jgi:phosphatidate cytidylyltransferase